MVNKANKRDEIIRAALELFFTYGYEGTSIRKIQNKVNSEVGLFYYYFKNKDDVFEEALNLFFEDYSKDFDKLYQVALAKPENAFNRFFEYIEKGVVLFRYKYEDKLHWVVRKAIRESAIDLIYKHILDICKLYQDCNMLKPGTDIRVLGAYLAHGTGGIILHEDTSLYYEQRELVKTEAIRAIGLTQKEAQILMCPTALDTDINNIVEFTGLDKEIVTTHINNKGVIITKVDDNVVGIIIISKDQQHIEYLMIDPKYRKKGIAERLVHRVIMLYNADAKITINVIPGELEDYCLKYGFKFKQEVIENNITYNQLEYCLLNQEL